MTDNPTTTGEWTAKRLREWIYSRAGTWETLAEAINAALTELRKQLAGVEPELKRLGEIELHYVESQRQLAAAQAEMGRATDATGISFDSSNDALDAAIDEARQPLVELLEQVLQETVNTPVYPDGPCLNKETRDDIKTELAKVKEGSYPLPDGRTR